MAATFSPGDITQPGANLGFDSLAGWVMVPQGGTKNVALKDGAGLALQLAPTGVAELSETSTQTGREILLTGKRSGTVRLEGGDPSGRAQGTLEISVKRRRTVSTFFHFGFDKSGRSVVRPA